MIIWCKIQLINKGNFYSAKYLQIEKSIAYWYCFDCEYIGSALIVQIMSNVGNLNVISEI